jgi:hypothetical protein
MVEAYFIQWRVQYKVSYCYTGWKTSVGKTMIDDTKMKINLPSTLKKGRKRFNQN